MTPSSPSLEVRLVHPYPSSEVASLSDRDIVLEKNKVFATKPELFAYLQGAFRVASASGSPYSLALRGQNDTLFLIADVSDATLEAASCFVLEHYGPYPQSDLFKACSSIISTINATGGIDEYPNGDTAMQAEPEWYDLCVAVNDLEHALAAMGTPVPIKRNIMSNDENADDADDVDNADDTIDWENQ